MTGPLQGLRVVELAGIGPGPHAAMILADLGAEVVRVERRPDTEAISDPTLRHRITVAADLKNSDDLAGVLALVGEADVLLEGFRPGTTERLGLGPDECLARNPRLVYGRMTGWGQDGPLAARAGHDINYISLTGALHAMGQADQPPAPPLNLVGDYGAGSMLLLVGVLAALWERDRSGQGQVIDAAIVDGTTILLQLFWMLRGHGQWSSERESNLLDGGAPFYRTYECADGRYVAVGAIEPRFYTQLLDGLSLIDDPLPEQNDREGWPILHKRFHEVFATRPRDTWAERFSGTDACVTPVLSLDEAVEHPPLSHRAATVTVGGVRQASPAPRFSRTPARPPAPEPPSNPDLAAAIQRWRNAESG